MRHLGFVSDEDKFDAMAAADVLVDAVVLREPVDGGARGVGARAAGARQRAVRRAAGASACGATPACSTTPSRSSPRRCGWFARRPGQARALGRERARLLPPALRVAGHRAASTSRCSTGSRARDRPPGPRWPPAFPGLVGPPKADAAARSLRRREGAGGTGARRDRISGWCLAGRRAAARTPRRPATGNQPRAATVNDGDSDTPGPGDARATATRSATRCSASGACCARPATSPRSSSRPPTRASEHLTRDYRDLVDASAPGNLLIHHFSIGSRASRVAFALPDRMVARLPQHHAARVLPRHPPAARPPVLPGAPGARGLRRALRPGARRLGVQPAGARGHGLPGHGGAAGGSRLLAPRGGARPARARGVRRRVDQRAVRGPDHPEQADRQRRPVLRRLPAVLQPPVAPARRRQLHRVRALLRDAAGAWSRGSGRPACTSSGTSRTGN